MILSTLCRQVIDGDEVRLMDAHLVRVERIGGRERETDKQTSYRYAEKSKAEQLRSAGIGPRRGLSTAANGNQQVIRLLQPGQDVHPACAR
jgi:hypothetical protein